MPENIRVMEMAANFYLRERDTVNAEKYLAMILEKQPNYPPAMMMRGEMAILKKKYADAIEMFNRLIKEEPRSVAAYYFRGIAYLGKGDVRLAKTSFQKAIELKPNFWKAKLSLADVFLRERAFELAQKECEEILERNPENYKAGLFLGNALAYQGKVDEAEKKYRSLIGISPDNPIAYFRLGLLQRSLKNYAPAIENMNKALSINPMLMDVFTNVVLVHAEQKNFDKAMILCDEKIEKAVEKPIVLALIHDLKGNLYLMQKKTAEAEGEFKKALQNNPDYLKSYYSLARIYIINKEEEKAVSQYKKIIEKNPQQAAPHMMLCTIYDMQKKFDLSENHYRRALEINPDFIPAANNLAYLLALQDKDIDVALGLAQKAKEKQPDNPAIMDTLGWIYYKKGLYDAAIRELQGSAEKIPENASVRYHLGLAYNENGNKELAKKEFAEALRIDEEFEGSDNARKLLSEL